MKYSRECFGGIAGRPVSVRYTSGRKTPMELLAALYRTSEGVATSSHTSPDIVPVKQAQVLLRDTPA